MSLQETTSFAAAVTRCRNDAMLEWSERNAHRVPVGDLFAHSLTSLTVEATLFPQGRMTVIVTLRGHKQHDDETYLFFFRRHSAGGYARTGDSLPSK